MQWSAACQPLPALLAYGNQTAKKQHVLQEPARQGGQEGRGWDLGFPGGDISTSMGTVVSSGAAPFLYRAEPRGPPALLSHFIQSHCNPQVNSGFLFIKFSQKTKQLIKKSKTQDLNVIYAPNYLILVGILVPVWSEH